MYMEKLTHVLHNDNVVFLIGVRRSGKTCIAAEFEEALRNKIKDNGKVVRYNFEAIEEGRITAERMISFFESSYNHDGMNYIILGEITHVDDWETAINYICSYNNCKLILCSSHMRVISQNLDAVRSNRYDVIRVLPMSLPEFIAFHGFEEVTDEKTPILEKRFRRFNGKEYSLAEVYRSHVIYGGLPIVKSEYMDPERAWVMMDGTYSAIVTRDVFEVGSANGMSAVTDPLLLRSVIKIMAKSMGENITATGVGRQTADYLVHPSTTKTIESYMKALLNANLFYISERYDLKAEQTLKTFAKYYIADTGLYRYLNGMGPNDDLKLLENKVYFELLRRGYSVCNGKYGRDDICLVARNGYGRVYIQVALGTEDIEAKLAPLRRIRDSYPKVVLVLNVASGILHDGVVVLNAMEFLMGSIWSYPA